MTDQILKRAVEVYQGSFVVRAEMRLGDVWRFVVLPEPPAMLEEVDIEESAPIYSMRLKEKRIEVLIDGEWTPTTFTTGIKQLNPLAASTAMASTFAGNERVRRMVNQLSKREEAIQDYRRAATMTGTGINDGIKQLEGKSIDEIKQLTLTLWQALNEK